MAEAVVIGAGPAGLSAAAMLRRRGVEALVLDRGPVAASWRHRYDRLRLNSTRLLSSLPGWSIPARNGRWVARDDYVAYLERYARRHGIAVRCGVDVERVEAAGDRYVVRTGEERIEARAVVVATGHDREPSIPDWPGLGGFAGEVMHSAAYLRPDPFRGRDVLVVGAGNSGMEIALDLAEGGAARVRLAVRTTPVVLAHQWLGIPVTWFGAVAQALPPRVRDQAARRLSDAMFGDLGDLGFPGESRTLSELLDTGRLPTIDKGTIAAIRAGQVEVVAGVERLEDGLVVHADGTRTRPDTIVAATAYGAALGPLVGHLDVVADDGSPRAAQPRPGLFFLGYRTPPLTGPLAQYRRGARRLAAAVERHLAAEA